MVGVWAHSEEEFSKNIYKMVVFIGKSLDSRYFLITYVSLSGACCVFLLVLVFVGFCSSHGIQVQLPNSKQIGWQTEI